MQINKKVAISESGFVFDSSTGDSYSLNPAGQEILEMIKNKKTINEIKKALLEKYDVNSTVLDKVLDDFIQSLKSFKIIED